MSNAVIVVCPYFGSEHPVRLTLNCEAGRVRFPDRAARVNYIRTHCGNLDGYKRCSLCRMMDAAYYRAHENAAKTPTTRTERTTGKFYGKSIKTQHGQNLSHRRA